MGRLSKLLLSSSNWRKRRRSRGDISTISPRLSIVASASPDLAGRDFEGVRGVEGRQLNAVAVGNHATARCGRHHGNAIGLRQRVVMIAAPPADTRSASAATQTSATQKKVSAARRTLNCCCSRCESRNSTPVLNSSLGMVQIDARPLRQLEQERQRRPQQAADEAAEKIPVAGKITACSQTNQQHNGVVIQQ